MLVAACEHFTYLCAGKFLISGDVENSSLSFREQFPTSASGHLCMDWTTKFICEKTQLLSALPRHANLFVESAIARRRDAAIERGADDGVAWISRHELFCGNFGFRIDAQRIGGISFGIVAFASIKHEISREEDEWDVCCEFGKQGCGFNIGFARERRVGLAIRRLGHGCAMDDGGWLLLVKRPSDSGRVEEVKCGAG